MSFLDNLSDYLRALGDTSASTAVVTPTAVDPATVRMQLIRILERLESAPEATSQVVLGSDKPDIHALLHIWQNEDAVVRFAKRMSSLLRGSFGKSATAKDLGEWVEVAIARRLGLRDSLTTQVRTLELDRLAEIAFNEVFRLGEGGDLSKLDIYAAAVRATRTTGGTVTLTAVGRVFLELSGRDAIRWLLYVETAQSTGPRDSWRISRETASSLIRNPHQVIDDLDDNDGPPHHWGAIRRLSSLGLVSITQQHWTSKIHLETTPLGLSLLAEVEKEVETPMSILANSLLADLTLSAGEAVARPMSTDADDARVGTAAEATARQARMVAHEIRNTLVPVKTALGALYREVLMEPPSEVLTRRRERIDRGIDATFRFIEQLVQLSKLAATPPEAFDLLPAIQDALASIEQEAGHRIDSSLPDALPPVSGHRARVVMALANVLRNASQAVPQQAPIIRIRAEVVDAARAVLVTVEDNGPGVPANMRRAIFDEGTSLRAGGSGLGLALVREVFEKEIRGLVACDASPLGGARFTIRIPVTGVERP